jgi:hypothetical protein
MSSKEEEPAPRSLISGRHRLFVANVGYRKSILSHLFPVLTCAEWWNVVPQ